MAGKSHVTRSLADGHARYSLRDIASKAKAVRVELGKEIQRHATLPVRKAGSRRVITRFHKKLYPLSLATCDVATQSTIMGGWVLPDVADKQLVLTSLLLGVSRGGTLAVDASTSTTITAHALGRLWQRTELEDLVWKELREVLGMPVMFTWAMRHVAEQLGFQRIALPCSDGLLVGKAEHSGLVLTTYLQPPLSKAWQEVHDVFTGMLEHFSKVAYSDKESEQQVLRMYKAGAVGLNVPEVQALLLTAIKEFDKQKFQWMKLVYNGEALG